MSGVPKKWTMRSLIAAAVLLTIPALVVAPAHADPKTITIAIEGDPAQLDPHTHSLWLTYGVIVQMFDGLVNEDLTTPVTGAVPVVPGLAESWDISSDGKVYTFHLRKGVKFHDGTDWNAQAAKFNFDRLLDPNSKYFSKVGSTLNSWWTGHIEKYEVVDDLTFKVTLKQVISNFLQRLCNGGYGSAAMLSPAALEKYGDEGFSNHPVGTGPFKFVERKIGERIVLEKNDDYWDPARRPKYDRLIFLPINDDSARELALMSGTADIIATPLPDSFDNLRSKGFNVVVGDMPALDILFLNMKDPKLADVRVRKAMAMAINRKDICEQLRLGTCVPATAILNPHGFGYDPNFQPFSYDPEGAKKLMAEAGYKDGIDLRFDWSPGGVGAFGLDSYAEWVQRDLGAIGVRVTLRKFDIATYFGEVFAGMEPGTQMLDLNWGEPSYTWLEFLVTSKGGYNAGHYSNPKVDELEDKLVATTDETQRLQYAKQIRDIIAEDVPWIPVFSQRAMYALSPRIKGFVLEPEHWQDFSKLVKD
jgi:peptide/nickel transport system substrate-binding protein